MGRVVDSYSPGEALEGSVVDVVGEVEVPLDDVGGEVLDESNADVLLGLGLQV